MKHVMDSQLVRPQWREGPLPGWLDTFADWLKAQGYVPRTAQDKVLLAARFSRWLGQEGINDLDRLAGISLTAPAVQGGVVDNSRHGRLAPRPTGRLVDPSAKVIRPN